MHNRCCRHWQRPLRGARCRALEHLSPDLRISSVGAFLQCEEIDELADAAPESIEQSRCSLLQERRRNPSHTLEIEDAGRLIQKCLISLVEPSGIEPLTS